MREVGLHSISIDAALKKLDTQKSGLTETEFNQRLQKYGHNQLSEKKETPYIIRFLLQFKNFFSILLLLGALLSFISEFIVPDQGSIYIAWALVGVTILNAAFTFLQEFKAEQAMKSFKHLMQTNITVIRNNHSYEVNSSQLVPGDIIELREGDKIPADARLIEVNELKVDHSVLTGESEPQLRSLESTSKKPLLSRNMVFSGTLVQSGTGKAVIVATGDDTEIGSIAKITNDVKVQTSHLQNELQHFISVISRIAIVLGIVFFGLGFFIGNSFWQNVVFAIGIIVANVPEGLLPTVTLTLSLAAQKLAKKNTLIKNIDAIETLGSLTVICSDKTGTLTENNLTTVGFTLNGLHYSYNTEFKQIQLKDKSIRLHSISGVNELNEIAGLCNNANIEDHPSGDPTEISLKSFVHEFRNVSYMQREHPRVLEIPFTSETKYMITLNKYDHHFRAYLKGAPEIALNKCSHMWQNGKVVKLTAQEKEKLLIQNEKYAQKGFRVLACGLKNTDKNNKRDVELNNYTFYGFYIMQDPPRKEVPQAVADCKTAGIKIIVISGDQPTTVASIAHQAGVCSKTPKILTNKDLSELDDEQLKSILKEKEIIIARALPADKLRIVTLLKEAGEIVAVTGDGVNDAPALKQAHVGVAMGKSGTEVAKEAADIVLLDDNFATIVEAIRQGRSVYDNIKSFITYILTSNTPEIIPFLLFVLFSVYNFPLALPVLLILAIDLGTDMLPAIGLGLEKPSPDIMKRQPRAKSVKLLNWKMIARSYGFIGLLQTIFAYIMFFIILNQGGWRWGDEYIDPVLYGTAVAAFFATIVITQMGNVFATRNLRTSINQLGFFSNRMVLLGIGVEILLLLGIVYIPAIERIFGIYPFPFYYVGIMILGAILLLLADELRKYFLKKYGWFDIE